MTLYPEHCLAQANSLLNEMNVASEVQNLKTYFVIESDLGGTPEVFRLFTNSSSTSLHNL